MEQHSGGTLQLKFLSQLIINVLLAIILLAEIEEHRDSCPLFFGIRAGTECNYDDDYDFISPSWHESNRRLPGAWDFTFRLDSRFD